MKKIIAMVMILSLVLMMGCAKETPVKPSPAAPTTPAETPTVAPPAEEAGAELGSELEGLEELDEDFLSEELDNLDSELDFEI